MTPNRESKRRRILIEADEDSRERVQDQSTVAADTVEPGTVEPGSSPAGGTEINWREKVLRLQAEMENFKRRQMRRAEERIVEEKADLLRDFLEIVDGLRGALARLHRDDPLYQGVRVTCDAMQKLLRREGVEEMEVLGKPFDPHKHEAVAMVPAVPGQQMELLIVDEEERGYRIGERVLRPARVVVARK
ncbi:MAG: nucleotide exchange factor GrpE [Anaerolineales bacterium]